MTKLSDAEKASTSTDLLIPFPTSLKKRFMLPPAVRLVLLQIARRPELSRFQPESQFLKLVCSLALKVAFR